MMSRRQFLTAALRPDRLAAAPRSDTAVTPAAQFFRQYQHPAPRIEPAFWALSIGGLVRHPLALSYDDLRALPAAEMPCTLICAANPPGGERIGHAIWGGALIADALDQLEIAAQATYARLEAAGGQRTVVPLVDLRRGLIACTMNGDTLLPDHGFPARLIIPGLYDHQSLRWIERIELADAPGLGGLWESRGWQVAGGVQTTSGITAPRHLETVSSPVALAGYAFAGGRAITTIELSIDGGPWMPIPFTPAPPFSWIRWETIWPAPEPGDYRVSVRAADSSGFLQTASGGMAFPHGSSAIHSVVIHVK